jgi:hypothetical protein
MASESDLAAAESRGRRAGLEEAEKLALARASRIHSGIVEASVRMTRWAREEELENFAAELHAIASAPSKEQDEHGIVQPASMARQDTGSRAGGESAHPAEGDADPLSWKSWWAGQQITPTAESYVVWRERMEKLRAPPAAPQSREVWTRPEDDVEVDNTTAAKQEPPSDASLLAARGLGLVPHDLPPAAEPARADVFEDIAHGWSGSLGGLSDKEAAQLLRARFGASVRALERIKANGGETWGGVSCAEQARLALSSLSARAEETKEA